MDDYGNYDANYYSNDGEDPLQGPSRGGSDGDPNDDFDPFELLTSPLFDGNKSRDSADDDAGSDYGGYSSQQQQQQQQQQQPQQQQRMPPAASVTPGSSAPSPSSPPFSGYGAQGPTPGSAGFRQQQYGGMNPQQMRNSGNGNSMSGGGGGGGGGMPQNSNSNNMSAMNNMNNGNRMNMNPAAAAAMGNSFGGMQGGGNVNVNQMGMQGMNAAALQQMGQMQGMGMQQAMRMQNNQMQANAAMRGNPMQGGAGVGGGGGGNPMMNAMQAGGLGPGGMGPSVQFAGANNPNMQGQMRGPMRPGPGAGGMNNLQMQGAGMNMNAMNNMQQNMNNMQQMQGAMNHNMNNINMQQMQNAMNGMSVNRNGSLNHNNAVANRQNGVVDSFHESLPNMHLQQSGSMPTSPNSVPSIAQMSASVRNSSSRSGARTRGPTPRVDANGKVIANTSSDPGINEAMEKLCESMRRSAMSRNLVKQLSGRSVQRQGSARSLSRSNSGVGMRKQLAGQGRSLSGNLGMGDDGSGRGTPTRIAPIRRSSASKHRLHQRAAPGVRGPFRQNSMGSQGGGSVGGGGGGNAGQTFLQLDDQSLGAL